MASGNTQHVPGAMGNSPSGSDTGAEAAAAAPASASAPPAAGAGAPAGARVVPLPLTIDVPNLRNGDATLITQAAPKASIASAYKWCVVRGMTHQLAIPAVDVMIRAQYAQLLNSAGGTLDDAGRSDAKRKAIVLGAIRSGAAAACQLDENDINPAETTGSGAELTGAVDNLRIAARTGSGTAQPKFALMNTMEALTPLEVKVVGMLVFLGMAVPALQGVSLVLSGHHYLPTTKNTFAGMRRQALQVGGSEVAAWVEQMGETFDDMAFHKACHPISPPRKRTWAKDSNLAPRLAASGHGAAAIRLPALPSDAQGGKAALAVIKKASPVIRGMGHTITWEGCAGLVRAVETAPEGREEMDAVNAVKGWIDGNAAQIAFCAGIVQTLSEAGGGAQETTLRAFSMRKLMSEQLASVVRGNTYCRAYNTRLRTAAESGEFPDPNLLL
jgi:hypothetical protein